MKSLIIENFANFFFLWKDPEKWRSRVFRGATAGFNIARQTDSPLYIRCSESVAIYIHLGLDGVHIFFFMNFTDADWATIIISAHIFYIYGIHLLRLKNMLFVLFTDYRKASCSTGGPTADDIFGSQSAEICQTFGY